MPSPWTATLNNLVLLYGFPNADVHVISCILVLGVLCAYLLQYRRPSTKTHLASAFRLAQKEPVSDRQATSTSILSSSLSPIDTALYLNHLSSFRGTLYNTLV